MAAWLKKLDMWSKPFAAAVCIGLVGVIGFLDYITGYEISFYVFYLIPVFFAVWRVGVPFAVVISILSVMTWLCSNIAAGLRFSNWFVPVWNSTVAIIFYLLVVR